MIHRNALLFDYSVAMLAQGKTKIEINLIDEERLVEVNLFYQIRPNQVAAGYYS